jgi:hypothetical protein
MIMTDSGIVIRLKLSQISTTGRVAQGVKLINLKDEQKVSAIAIVEQSLEEEINNDSESNETNTVDNKEQVIEKVTDYNKNNNEKRKQWTKNYRIKNIDKINQYRNKNKEDLKNYHNKYMKDRMQRDSAFKLKALFRSNIYNAFKRKNMIKDEKAEEILGCNIDEFVQYLLHTFKDNYGYEYNGTEEVHIDHIVPLATAKTKQDIKKLCNYKNLQLLKAHDNLIKWACN